MYIIFFTYTVAYSHPDLDFRSCSCHLFFGFPMIYPGEHFNLQRINQPRKKWWNLATPQHLVYFLPGIICAASCCAQLSIPAAEYMPLLRTARVLLALGAGAFLAIGTGVGESWLPDTWICSGLLHRWILQLWLLGICSIVWGHFKPNTKIIRFLTQLRNLSNLYEHSYWP